jgi:hypothetical protein
MDVRHVVLRSAGEAGRRDRGTLLDECAALDEQCADMHQRDLVAARRQDRDGEPVHRHLACEGHLACDRSAHDLGCADGDVDAAVLPSRIRVVAEREGAEHVALDGPGPCSRLLCGDESPDERDEQDQARLRCPMREHGASVASGPPESQRNLRSCYRVAR